MKRFPHVAVVGRTNVGKSTLFNRLLGNRQAITDNAPGVTRDLIYGDMTWGGRDITLVDTGGYDETAIDEIGRCVMDNVRQAAEESVVAIFVVDGLTGPTASDYEVLDLLRRRRIPAVLAVNKLDNINRDPLAADFYGFGLDPVIPISAVHGHGTGDLLDAVIERLPPEGEAEPETQGEVIRVAIVGRPNVGKSTLLNALCGHQRSIVTSVAGTTRDPVDTLVTHDGKPFLLIDTAGIRRAGKIDTNVERYSVLRARNVIERSDVVLLVIDAVEGVTETDARVFSLVDEMGRAAVLCVNKWDAVEKETGTAEACAKDVRNVLRFLRRAPILFLSAKTGQRVQKIFGLIDKVYASYIQRIPTGELNQFLDDIQQVKPATYKGKLPGIQYITQAMIKPPTFVLFCKEPRYLHESWRRYLINQIYDRYDFEGAPLVLRVRSSSQKGARGSAG